MLRKLLASASMLFAANAAVGAIGMYSPYAEPHVNFFYNLLFCDDAKLFKPDSTGEGVGLWKILLADPPDKTALLKLANDDKNDGRMRALAYNRLRLSGQKVPPKRLLGVIVEVRLQQGLDVLAAFSEGGVRYLNQSGKIAVFEGENTPIAHMAKELVLVSQAAVNQIGPWDKQRLPPPKVGNVRISFLVSDGLYFGEGPFSALQTDPMAGPVLAKAAQLLQKVVDIPMK